MTPLSINTDQGVKSKFEAYPNHVRPKMESLRSLILDKAKEVNHITEVLETLKWGEPSYLVKKGSTIRMDWKARSPNQYALYFSCSTQLVTTFRELYSDQLNFEKNRAIVFDIDKDLPIEIIEHCIEMALCYHKLKHLPLLGN